MPVVVEVREQVSERGVFWTERLLIGVEGQVLLDTRQLGEGIYDSTRQEMVYRVLAPLWTLGLSPSETFVWAQVQWVGVPLSERNAPAYQAGDATDAVDITVDSEGNLIVSQSASLGGVKGTGTHPDASERRGTRWQRGERRRLRSADALRKEAQRRLRRARRTAHGKRGSKSTTPSKPRPRTDIKRSHDPNPPYIALSASPPFPICDDGMDGRMIVANTNAEDGSIVTFSTSLGTVTPAQAPVYGGITTTVLRANPANATPYGTATVTGSVSVHGVGVSGSTTVDIVGVTSVEWVVVKSPLTDNPTTHGGGKRIFPEWVSPDPPPAFDPACQHENSCRDQVSVRATISPALNDITVRFRLIDMDDPTANTAPLDDETLENDNKGGQPMPPLLSATTTNGVATATFTLTRQPGDNYRAVADCSETYINRLRNIDPNDGMDVFEYDEGNRRTVPDRKKVAQVLFVWRTVHVEVDSMGAPTGTTVSGTITSVDDDPNDNTRSIVTTNQTLQVPVIPGNTMMADSENRFMPGRLVSNNVTYNVRANGTGANFTVTVDKVNGQGPTMNSTFDLYDDDDVPADVPDPITTELQNKFLPAFIVVALDGGGNAANNEPNLPFGINFRSYSIFRLEEIAQPVRQSVSRAEYWATHCYGAFQGIIPADDDPEGDPDPMGNLVGITQGVSSRRTAFVFSEHHREYNYQNDQVALGHILVHEVGHNFRLHDEYGWINGDVQHIEPGLGGTFNLNVEPRNPNTNVRISIPTCVRYVPGILTRRDAGGNPTNDRWNITAHTSGNFIQMTVTGNGGQQPPLGLYRIEVDRATYRGIMFWVWQGDFTNANLHGIRGTVIPSNGEECP